MMISRMSGVTSDSLKIEPWNMRGNERCGCARCRDVACLKNIYPFPFQGNDVTAVTYHYYYSKVHVPTWVL